MDALSDLTRILSFVVRMPDTEVVGLGFNPWVGRLETWDFFWGRSQRNCTLNKIGGPPANQLRLCWLECVEDKLSALAVKISLSLTQYPFLMQIKSSK
jgi:hypothetical protein